MKQLKFISDKTTGCCLWNLHFTVGKVYLELEKRGSLNFVTVRANNGDIKHVPGEYFEDVTKEVDQEFKKKVINIIKLIIAWFILISLMVYLIFN